MAGIKELLRASIYLWVTNIIILKQIVKDTALT